MLRDKGFEIKTSTVFTLLIAIALLGLCIERLFDFGWKMQDGLFPLIIGIPTIALGTAQIILDMRHRQKPKEAGTGIASDASIGIWIRSLKGENLCYVIAFAWIVGLVIMIYLLGYYVAIPLFLLLYFKLHGRRWRSSIALCLIISAVLYLSFVLGFKFTFYKGLLFKGLMFF